MSIDRRSWLVRAAAGALGGAGALVASGCDNLTRAPAVRSGLSLGERLTQSTQRLFLNRRSLAREYLSSDIAPSFKANGSKHPLDPEYQAHAANSFHDWRLVIDGLVNTPLSLSLDDLRAASTRTQITRHD